MIFTLSLRLSGIRIPLSLRMSGIEFFFPSVPFCCLLLSAHPSFSARAVARRSIEEVSDLNGGEKTLMQLFNSFWYTVQGKSQLLLQRRLARFLALHCQDICRLNLLGYVTPGTGADFLLAECTLFRKPGFRIRIQSGQWILRLGIRIQEGKNDPH
jgi:hypothetical protein